MSSFLKCSVVRLAQSNDLMHSSSGSHSCGTGLHRGFFLIWFNTLACFGADPAVSLSVCHFSHLEDRLASFSSCLLLRLLLLRLLRLRLLRLHHPLSDILLFVQGLLLLPPLAPGLHPGYQTQHGPSNDGGDTCQVEGHVVASQSVPQEP